MTVSARRPYSWQCTGCGRTQQAGVWRLLDARERAEVVEELRPGLAEVACSICGTMTAIDAPLLLIRPGNVLPLLLALPLSELAEVPPPCMQEMVADAQTALAGRADGIAGPMVPLPRALLPTVLTRDVTADATDPDRAYEEVLGRETTMASWYGRFLQFVRDTAADRRLALALHELWRVPQDDLYHFLQVHPELRSAEAVAAVSAQLRAGPPPGETDEPLRARLRLVQSLASGRPPALVADEYLRDLGCFGQHIDRRLRGLLDAAEGSPGASGIPAMREALGIATAIGREDLEAHVGQALGARLMSLPYLTSEIVEEIIGLLTRALQLIPSDDPRVATVGGNLAAAYQRRLLGDQDENWKAGKDLLDRACKASDRAADPRIWAINQTNYGLHLADRPGGSSNEDLSLGIEHIRAGLEERSPTADPVDWGYSQLNLGLLHWRRGASGDEGVARDCYRAALAHLRSEDDLPLWTALQHNLADLLLYTDPPDVGGAEAAVQAALSVTSEATDPLNAGRLLGLQAHIEDHRAGQLGTEAIRLRLRAFQLLSPRLAPALNLRVGGELADAYGQLGDWNALSDIYAGMLVAQDSLYDLQVSPVGRRRVLAQYPRLARWAAFAFASAGRAAQAVEAVEQGRARQLSDAVSRDTADLARLATIEQPLVNRYRTAVVEYRVALRDAAGATVAAGVAPRLSEANRQVEHVVAAIREIPGFDRFLRAMSVADVAEVADGHPVVYLVTAPAGSCVLTVQSQVGGKPSVDVAIIPEVTSTNIAELLYAKVVGDVAIPGLAVAQYVDEIRRRQLFPKALERLGEIRALIEPLVEVLNEDDHHTAVVIPTGLLGLVPLHAVPVGHGRVLDDVGEVHLAPSAAVYAACRKRASEPRLHHLVGLADPDGSLPGSLAELASISAIFGSQFPKSCCVGRGATRSWLIENAPAASHLHLACHGRSTFDSPLGGVLQLAGVGQLTMEDFLATEPLHCRLAVASACQSGHYELTETPDEFSGLPAGLLQAGAACAIVSLWQVDDLTTALLMTRFYELLHPIDSTSRQQPTSALREARAWLRQVTTPMIEDFIMAHRPLADILRPIGSRGPTTPASGNRPYASPQFWAGFAAYGC